MDTLNNNRAQTDQTIYDIAIGPALSLIPDEMKIQAFDEILIRLGAILNDQGFIRTENVLETAVAIKTSGVVVQATGYDVIAAMQHKTEVKSSGTRTSYKTKQAKWVSDTAQVKLSGSNTAAEYFFFTISLNREDGTTEPVMYLIPRSKMLTKAGSLRTQIDFNYGRGASIHTGCQWYPFMFRSLDELRDRYEALPILKKNSR